MSDTETTPTRIYLLRHGATAANRSVPYRLQGQNQDLPLDEIGREQARRAAEALCAIPLVAAYCSPLLRAYDTARQVGARLGLEPTKVPELNESAMGQWEGLTWDEVRQRDPEHYDAFMADPGTTPYRGGESFLDVQRRAVPAIARIAAAHPGSPVLVVAHNVVNRAYLAAVIGLPIREARGLPQANGGINLIEYRDGQPKLVTLNAALHLDGLA